MSATLPASTLPLRGDTDMTDKTDAEEWKADAENAHAFNKLLRKQLDEARVEVANLRHQKSELGAQLFLMTEVVTNAELKLAEKHCEWPAFRHAFNAVMKARRAALSQEPPASHAPKFVCSGCGSTETIDEIRSKHPQAISCCPERSMNELIAQRDAPASHAPGLRDDVIEECANELTRLSLDEYRYIPDALAALSDALSAIRARKGEL